MDGYSYFQSYRDYFWQWEEEGRVVGIPEGRTIAYSTYLTEVLHFLADQGIPRFGPLLLALLATSPRDAASEIFDALASLKSRLPDANEHHLNAFRDAEIFLLTLASLPREFKVGGKRLLVLQTIFKDQNSPIRPFAAREILHRFANHQFDQAIFYQKKGLSSEAIYSDFHPFIRLRRVFPDVKDIIKHIAQLPEWEEEAPEPGEGYLPKPEERALPGDGFFQQLLQNPETRELGALIPHIWSALEIHFHNRLPGNRPMGGVADLSNKGEIHHLLISEFAHDDIVFLSRLANNEALYFKREIPPQSDDRERVLLIDVSLKNWGAPHTIAFALMLAIARHPKSGIPCSAYAVHDLWKPIRFDDIGQVIDGLMILEPCLHPAAGLERFFRENPEKIKAEIFLLSTRETLALPAMRRGLAKYPSVFSYLFLSDRQGKVDIYKKQKHLKTFQLPLDELWARKLKKTKEPKQGLVKVSYPLLFPAPNGFLAVFHAGEDIYLLARSRMLLRKAGKQSKYWEILYENIPRSADHLEIGRMKNGKDVLLAFSSQTKQLLLLDIQTGETKKYIFNEWNSRIHKDFVFYEDRFYCPGREICTCWDPDQDRQLEINAGALFIGTKISELLNEKIRKKPPTREEIPYAGTIFKNIHAVWINDSGNLCFNYQELVLVKDHFYFKLLRGKKASIAQAFLSGENEFTFPDGSRVLVHPAGMLTLKSSEESIPSIFISSRVEKTLVLCTETQFSGYAPLKNIETKFPMSTILFMDNYLKPFIRIIAPHA